MLYRFVQNDVKYEKECLTRKRYFLVVINLITLASETEAKYAFCNVVILFIIL